MAPELPWPDFISQLKSAGPEGFRQGDHVLLLGTTGTGKTHMALTLAEFREYAIFLATKRRDPLVAELESKGWTIQRDLKLEYIDSKPRHGHIVYWPPLNEKLPLKEQNVKQAADLREAIQYVERHGKWALVVDEYVWVDGKLKLRDEMETLLFRGRTAKTSVIACAQRPAWISRFVYSQSDHIFFWRTNDHEDLKRLGDISGIDRKLAMDEITSLDTESHEALYVNTRTREMYRVTAPPR